MFFVVLCVLSTSSGVGIGGGGGGGGVVNRTILGVEILWNPIDKYINLVYPDI